MKKNLFIILATFVAAFTIVGLYGFAKPADDKKSKVLVITTAESLVGGGAARSRMIISEEGKSEELKIENLYSLVGLNISNLKSNDVYITEKIQAYLNEGYQIISSNASVTAESGGTSGLLFTRYVLKKDI